MDSSSCSYKQMIPVSPYQNDCDAVRVLISF